MTVTGLFWVAWGAGAEVVRVELPGNTGVEDRRIDDAQGECEVGPLDGDAKVRLSGKVRVLRIASVGGAAMLDAAELDAGEVIVTGPIGGGTRVRVCSPKGNVTFAGAVGGGAAVEINAPAGAVYLRGENGEGLREGARLAVHAKDFSLKGGGSGGSRVELVISSGGKVAFDRLGEGAHLSWRKSAESDPEPSVEAGEIFGGAGFGQAGKETRRARAEEQRQERRERMDAIDRPAISVRPDVGKEATPGAVGPVITVGVIDASGARIAAEIVGLDDSEVKFRREGAAGGQVESMRLTDVSAVILSPVAESKRDLLLDHDQPGLLLRSGDFVDGDLKKFDRGGRVTVSSVVFGLKSFDAGRDAVAVFIRRPMPGAAK